MEIRSKEQMSNQLSEQPQDDHSKSANYYQNKQQINLTQPNGSAISKKSQITSKKTSFRIPSNDYSRILQSFNKRLTDLYTLGEDGKTQVQNHQNDSAKHNQKSQGQKNTNQNVEASDHLKIILNSIQPTIKPFSVQQQDYEQQWPNKSPKRQNCINKLILTNLKGVSYENISHVDPYLQQLGSQLDREHMRKKQELMEEKFIKRYQELIDNEKGFQIYKKRSEAQICELSKKMTDMIEEKRILKERYEEVQEEIKNSREELMREIKRARADQEGQSKRYENRVRQLSQIIDKKDREITKMQKEVIDKLQLRLDEQVEQNLQLNGSIQQYLGQIAQRDSELQKMERKKQQLIETLQKSLNQCENEKNAISEDFEGACEQLHRLKQSHVGLRQQMGQLQAQNHLISKQLQASKQQLTLLHQTHQTHLYQNKTKYLQQLKQKNAIIQQLEQVTDKNHTLQGDLAEIRQKVILLERHLIDKERQIRTDRAMYVENCAQYQQQLTQITLKLKAKEKEVQLLKSDLDALNTNLLSANHQLNQQLASLHTQITHQTDHLHRLQQQCTQLRQFKNTTLQSFSQSKSSFHTITQQLKSQLIKAQQIIRSKNYQINEGRQLIFSLKNQLRREQSKCCHLENDLEEIKEKQKLENGNIKEQARILEEELQSVKEDFVKKVEERDQRIEGMSQKLKEYQREISDKVLQISSLQLEIQTIAKQLKEDKLIISQLKNDIHIQSKHLTSCQKSFQQQLASCDQQFQNQKQNLLAAHQHQKQLSIKDYQQTLHAKDSKLAQLRQQLNSALKQVQTLTAIMIEVRKQRQQVQVENQQLRANISTVEKNFHHAQQKSVIWQQKYQSQHQLILQRIHQKNAVSLDQSSQSLQQRDQNLPCQPSDHPQKNPTHPQSKFIEKKYLNIIEAMKLQIIELALYFKEKSAHEEGLRIILETQNQELTAKLIQLNPKSTL